MARAAAEFGVEWRVSWHPYLLDVKLPAAGLTRRASYASKGMTPLQLAKMERKMTTVFAGEGIAYGSLDGFLGAPPNPIHFRLPFSPQTPGEVTFHGRHALTSCRQHGGQPPTRGMGLHQKRRGRAG